MPTIRTITTITITQQVPYTEDYYPGQSLAEAVQYEEQLPRPEIIENFAEALSFEEDQNIQVSREIGILQDDGTEVGHHRLEAIKGQQR